MTTNGGVYSNVMTWNSSHPNVDINILWSKQSFAGNWQLSPSDVSIVVADACGATISTSGCTDSELRIIMLQLQLMIAPVYILQY